MFRNRYFISDYYNRIFEDIRRDILTQDDSYIAQTLTEEYVQSYFGEHSLSSIKFDDSRQESFKHKKEIRIVPAHKREEFYRNEGDLEFEFESIEVSMPIIPNDKLETILNLSASTFSLKGDPIVDYSQDTISFSFDIKGYGFSYDNNKIEAFIDRKKNEITEWINRKNRDIKAQNTMLKTKIREIVEERKQKLTDDDARMTALMQSLNMPLRDEENELKRKIKLDSKPLIREIGSTHGKKIEYEIDRDIVMKIISFIDNQGRQFENTPDTFRSFKEEDFRNTLIVSLNSIFEGKATGETFSKKGKTDIYLNIEKGEILIFECKIWAGKRKYAGTIDQLFRYLTWRNNFGIIITFAKRKDFSKVLKVVENAIVEHSTYKSNFKHLSQTHFESTHTLKEDKYKSVEIHHLFYNLFAVS